MLSFKQYRKLKQMKLLGGCKPAKNEKERELYNYLLSERLIVRAYYKNTRGYKISQKGHAALREYKVERIRFWLPIIISSLALIISVLQWLLPQR